MGRRNPVRPVLLSSPASADLRAPADGFLQAGTGVESQVVLPNLPGRGAVVAESRAWARVTHP
jgi:hypothetical protein